MATKAKFVVLRGDNGWNNVPFGALEDDDHLTIIPGANNLALRKLVIPATYSGAIPTDTGVDTGIVVSSGQVVNIQALGNWVGIKKWYHEFDFQSDDGDWGVTSVWTGGDGTYVPYNYWQGVTWTHFSILGIARSHTPSTVTAVEVRYYCSTVREGEERSINYGDHNQALGDSAGTHTIKTNNIQTNVSVITIYANAHHPTAQSKIHYVRIWGYGLNPFGETSISSIDANGDPTVKTNANYRFQNAPAYSLVGRIGTSGNWFLIGEDATFTATSDGPLYLAMNDDDYTDGNAGSLLVDVLVRGGRDCSTKLIPASPSEDLVAKIGGGSAFAIGARFDGNIGMGVSGALSLARNGCADGTVSAWVIVNAPDPCDNNGNCDSGSYFKEIATLNPIELRTANKIFSTTDLRLQSPAGALNFTRSYNQSRLTDSRYQFMGLGWSHNHQYVLTFSGSSPNRVATIFPPDGGQVVLDETGGAGGHFEARLGSAAVLDYDSPNNEYIFTTPSRTTFVYDDSSPYTLKRRTWPNDEVWTYTHSGSDLTKVEDGYGRELTFTYYSGETGGDAYKNGQLKRVQARNTLLGSPDLFYVDLDYTPEKSNGTPIGSPKALLLEVTDPRNASSVWTYTYFGQAVGETDSNKLNFLTKRESPDVDTTGDGTNDSPLTLESLSYSLTGATINSITQQRGGGLIESLFTFQSGTTTEEIADLVTTHHFANGVYIGPKNPNGDMPGQAAGDDYRPFTQADANGNPVELAWSNDGKRLDEVTDALNHETEFVYNADDTLHSSEDAEGRITVYGYGTTIQRQPTLILVTDGRDLVVNGDMELDSNWAGVSSPTTNQRSSTQVNTGSYSRDVSANAANKGIQSDPISLVAGRTYVALAYVYATSGTVKMQLSSASQTTVTGDQNKWTLLKIVFTATSSSAVNLQFLANGGAADFYVDTVHVFDNTILLRWQEFVYDSQGRTTDEKLIDPADGTTLLQHTTRTYYDAGDIGNGLLEEVTQTDIGGTNDVTTTYFYDGAGRVVQVNQSSNFGSCSKSRTVYDNAGNVVATLCNFEPGTNNPIYPTTVAEAQELRQRLYDTGDADHYTDSNINRLTIYEYDTVGRRVKTITSAEDPYQLAALTVYDALNRVVRTINNYIADAAITNPYTAPRSAFQTGPDDTWNLITETAYNARGMVRKQTDVLGNVTLYGYDDAGRLIKSTQSASLPNYNNDYTGSSPDPGLSLYPASDLADKDIISTQEYDAAGNLVKSVDGLGHASYTVYDALNRPVKTVRSAKAEATLDLLPGDTAYKASNDPRSDDYLPSADPDRDLMETTEYDALGRVVRTHRLLDNRPTELWDTTLYGYDLLGRQVKVIRSASQADYDTFADPDLSEYLASDDSDVDIITQTAYDVDGRVLYSEDALGNRTWFAYDGLGRQISTIVNPSGEATDNGIHDPRSPYYNPVVNVPDVDLINRTFYDDDGRVLYSADVLDRRSWSGYDDAGRVVRMVQNAVGTATDGGPHDPRSPAYIRSSDTDKDILSETIYDEQGRVLMTRDTRGNQTRYTYDVLGRRVTTITNFVDGVFNPNLPDEDRTERTIYDRAGRVAATIDAAGIETRYSYDALGRRVQTILNYVDGHFDNTQPDQDLMSTTTYNQGGQVVSTTDPRGTETTFTYDHAGRRLTVTQAAQSPLATDSYTCYDKGGRVLRTIANYQPLTDVTGQPISPDAKDEAGNWLFMPPDNGTLNDTNLINESEYDRAGRRTTSRDPLGNAMTTAYFKDGQVDAITDPEGMVTAYRYDRVRRRTRVVQGYIPNGDDPAHWTWTGSQWERTGGVAIAHGAKNDQNIIVDVSYDPAGRMVSLRDPRGNVTTYEYDLLNRRIRLTNALDKSWRTRYENLFDGQTRTTMTYPGLATGGTYDVTRDFDKLGRLTAIQYGSPSTTPDVQLSYDSAGNRATMTEYGGAGFTNPVRATTYSYDEMHRLTSVGFDNDGGGSVDETVAYEYDAGGLRTKLTMPGGLEVTYTYDQKGRLISLTDWDDQPSQMAYDNVNRLVATFRANGLRTRQGYDAAGRLRLLRHDKGFKTLGHFEYEVDKRGNRTKALECLPHPATANDTTYTYDDASIIYTGAWTDVTVGSDDFKQSVNINAKMRFMFFGSLANFTIGTGSDFSIFDVYIDKTLWQSFDGYSTSPTTRQITIALQGEGPHLFEIRNRPQRNLLSAGYKLQFKELVVLDAEYDLQTIEYTYDLLSRIADANVFPGINTGATPTKAYAYEFDPSGNRTQETIDGTPTNYTYNDANQLTNSGFTFDDNGNMTSDGTNTHVWDRANRLLSMGGHSYAYNGDGIRVSQTVSSVVTQYLLDTQPGLAMVLSATANSATTRYIHGPMGIFAQEDNSGVWTWPLPDGLRSVRSIASNAVSVLGVQNYSLYGIPDAPIGTVDSVFKFTGEMRDETGVQYHRARYYAPNIGIFPSLDPFEGMMDRPMSLNGYAWVEGNVVNARDASGQCPENPWWNDIPGQRCVYLANRFCENNGCSQEGLNRLLKLSYGELELLTALEAGNYWNGYLQFSGNRINEFLSCPTASFNTVIGTVMAYGQKLPPQFVLGTLLLGTIIVGIGLAIEYNQQVKPSVYNPNIDIAIEEALNSNPQPQATPTQYPRPNNTPQYWPPQQPEPTATQTEEFIYKGGNRKKDLALSRQRDRLTGLSFFEIPYGPSFKYSVSRLRASGFEVRYDANQLVTVLWTGEPYIEPNSGWQIEFPEDHVSVWHSSRQYWEEWFQADSANLNTPLVSPQLEYFYGLREV